jgi:hypothetical protein
MAKPPKKCIFCQLYGNMSKEHLWSGSMADMFPKAGLQGFSPLRETERWLVSFGKR